MSLSYEQINTTVKQQLKELADESAELTDDSDIINELGLDSFKVLDLLMDIEDEFDVSIPMNVLTDVHTVKDLCEKIHEISNS